MRASLSSADRPSPYRITHPKRFMMWLYLITVMMIFAGLTSAVLVSEADYVNRPGGWADFYTIPSVFTLTSILVVLSSATAQWGYFAARANQHSQLLIALMLTALLGVGFLFGQYLGFEDLYQQGVYLVADNPSGAFVYIITAMHGLHLVAALIALMVMVIQAARFRINARNTLGLEMTVTFWHALGFLWVYLFVFLTSIYD